MAAHASGGGGEEAGSAGAAVGAVPRVVLSEPEAGLLPATVAAEVAVATDDDADAAARAAATSGAPLPSGSGESLRLLAGVMARLDEVVRCTWRPSRGVSCGEVRRGGTGHRGD